MFPPSDPCRSCIDAYVRHCAAIESPPRVSELAARFGFSDPSLLNRRYRRRYGVCVSSYLKQRQLALAEDLMRETDWTTATIAYRCGFGTRRTFFRVYRRFKGETPASYRSRRE